MPYFLLCPPLVGLYWFRCTNGEIGKWEWEFDHIRGWDEDGELVVGILLMNMVNALFGGCWGYVGNKFNLQNYLYYYTPFTCVKGKTVILFNFILIPCY